MDEPKTVKLSARSVVSIRDLLESVTQDAREDQDEQYAGE